MKFRQRLVVLLAIFMVAQGALYNLTIHDRWAKDYAPKGNLVKGTGLSPDQFLFALAGFREMIAGILWVRGDTFFDQGQYDAILPIIRLVTILDPKQIDVYTTGMWHIGYNFTDEDERSDRRYLPSAFALGKEGEKNNPETYEMSFELGWTWFNKVDDNYDKAVKYFEKVETKTDAPPARRHLLANAYQRNGEQMKALEHYYKLLDEDEERVKKDPSYGNKSTRDTDRNNLDNLLVRLSSRGGFAEMRGEKDLSKYDVYPPKDVNFQVKTTIVEPRVLKIEGFWNVLPIGTRIRVVLRDANFPNASPSFVDWDTKTEVDLDPPRDLTFMQDQLYVKNRRFNKIIDMSKDSTMYPFTADKYVLEFYYNPRSAAIHMQDAFGFNGEGIYDKYALSSLRKGEKIIFLSFPVTRDQLLRTGEWDRDTGKIPVIKSQSYLDTTQTTEDKDVILIPSLRGKK